MRAKQQEKRPAAGGGGMRTISALFFLLVCWSSRTATTHALQAAQNANNHRGASSPPPQLTEVIGGSGRIGSQFMRLIAQDQEQDRDWEDAPRIMALPRGVCPGSLSSASAAGQPIFVCTPAGARWASIYEATLPPQRRSDLVFCGNGLLPEAAAADDADAVTLMVPHYAVTTVGARAAVAPTAPPTYLAGPHAATVQRLLRRDGICNTEILSSCSSGMCAEIRVKAAQKLLWASCLWLLCHLERGRPPITVAEVYEEHIEVLFGLVHELWPAFEALLRSQTTTTTNEGEASETTTTLPTLPETLVYFQDYTLSIPDAIPSLDLAIAELADRNGVLAAPNQPLHRQLVEQVAGMEAARSIFGPDASEDGDAADGDDAHEMFVPPPQQREAPTIVDLRETIGVAVYSTTTQNKNTQPKPTNIVVVGAGILGSSVALNLARQRNSSQHSHSQYRITVVDPSSSASEPSATTRSSWAWLNANEKKPPSYQQLNALGLHAWRCDPLLADLPDWKGSLVQFDSDGEDDDDAAADLSCVGGFYAQPIGPLTEEEWRALEPNVQFAKKTLSKANRHHQDDGRSARRVRVVGLLLSERRVRRSVRGGAKDASSRSQSWRRVSVEPQRDEDLVRERQSRGRSGWDRVLRAARASGSSQRRKPVVIYVYDKNHRSGCGGGGSRNGIGRFHAGESPDETQSRLRSVCATGTTTRESIT